MKTLMLWILWSVICVKKLNCENYSAINDLQIVALNDQPRSNESRPFQAYLVGSFVSQPSQLVHYDIAKPTLELAIKEVNRRYSTTINFNLIVKNDTDSCISNIAGGLVAEEFLLRKAHAFIGPACDLALDQVGRMAAYWKVPIFTAGGFSVSFGDKSIYSTLTRLAFSLDRIGHFLLQILKENNWHHISVLVNTSDLTSKLIYKSLDYVLKLEFEKSGFDVKLHKQEVGEDVHVQSSNITSLTGHLMESGKKSREKTLLEANELGMGNGEYVFFAIDLMSKSSDDGKIGWYKLGDRQNKEAKSMFEALMVLTVRVPISPEYNTYVYEVVKMANENSGSRYTSGDINPIVAAFYDCIIIYGWALNKTLEEGGDPYDGNSVARRAWGRTFYQGLTGDILINDNGDREADYTLSDLDPDTGAMRPVANYYGAKRSYEKIDGVEIHWPGGKDPPLDVPVCGFTGDNINCLPKEGFPLLISFSLVLTVLTLIISVVLYFIKRKLKLESDIADEWWRIHYEELRFPEQRSQSRVRSAASLTISITGPDGKLSCPSIATSMNTTMANIHGVDCALYRGLKVAVKNVTFNGKFHVNRATLIELKEMRQVMHDNLVKFYGICTEDPNTCFVNELCTRGSLRDILENESISIDWLFRYAIMNDIVEGMNYLHNSPIEYHGHLKSTNLVVDGRFTVKICDYGLHHLVEQLKFEEMVNPRSLFWTAPEHLREKEPMRAGSKKGDVYSFAVILQEIINRQGPFDVVDRPGRKKETFDPDTVLDKLRMGLQPPFRPQISADECIECPEARILMQKCWAEIPTDRPDFSHIKSKLKIITKGVNSKNFLDNLLKRLEQYSNNLEAIVAEKTETIVDEKAKCDELIAQILPLHVANELREGRHVQPEDFDSVTVYFSDVIGFSNMASDSSPDEVVDLLNDIYSTIDGILANYDVFKVETIADAYLVASGLPIRNGNEHAREIARMALDLRIAMRSFKAKHRPNETLQIRIGIHSGSCVAGVIGLKMPKYCLFGDTINTASRMETNSEPGRIHISPVTKSILDMFGSFIMMPRGEVEIKGKGKIKTFWLEGEDRSFRN